MLPQYHKIVNHFLFELVKKKIWVNLLIIKELYTQKIVIKLSRIKVWDPEKTYSVSRIQGQKGTGSATLIDVGGQWEQHDPGVDR